MQNGQKTKRSASGRAAAGAGLPQVLFDWRNSSPTTTREELAVVCERSVSTIDRWARGVGEPTVTDVWLMEKHKPGIVAMLFKSAKPRAAARP